MGLSYTVQVVLELKPPLDYRYQVHMDELSVFFCVLLRIILPIPDFEQSFELIWVWQSHRNPV